jgi:hypothetical protein
VRKNLTIWREWDNRLDMVNALGIVTALLALEGRAEAAVRLASAVETFRAGTGRALGTGLRRTLDRCLTPARQALDEATLSRAEAAGRALSLEQAVEEALAALG